MTYPYEVSKAQEEIQKTMSCLVPGEPIITSGRCILLCRDGREYLDCESQAWS